MISLFPHSLSAITLPFSLSINFMWNCLAWCHARQSQYITTQGSCKAQVSIGMTMKPPLPPENQRHVDGHHHHRPCSHCYTMWTPSTGTYRHPPCGFLLLPQTIMATVRCTDFHHVSCVTVVYHVVLSSGHTKHTVPHFLLPNCKSPQTYTSTLIPRELLQLMGRSLYAQIAPGQPLLG